jgi:calcium-dependent protein kinase
MTKTYGTVYYIAPEVLLGRYDEKCDVWSVGVIIFILLCGCVPFGGESDEEIFDSIRSAPLKFFSPYWDHISDSVKDLVSHMLDRNPVTRYTME